MATVPTVELDVNDSFAIVALLLIDKIAFDAIEISDIVAVDVNTVFPADTVYGNATFATPKNDVSPVLTILDVDVPVICDVVSNVHNPLN